MTTVYLYFVVFVPGIFCVTPCAPGLYGELCDKHCDVNCRAHVNKQRYCDKDTGDCSAGCVSGRWGSHCGFPCSTNCVDRVCFQQTGQCTKGCTENYRGDLCEEYIERATETPTKDPPEGTQSYKPYTTDPVIVVSVSVTVAITVILVVVAVARRWKSRRTRYRRRLDYDDKRRSDLHKASCCGDISRVKSILSRGQVDINCVDTYGRTPVMWAARQKQNEVFAFLVSNGSSLSLTDKNGNNILHSACHGGHTDIVQNILSKESVDINSKDRDGRTAVMIAERKGYKDVVDLLVRNGADLPVHDKMETQFPTEPHL